MRIDSLDFSLRCLQQFIIKNNRRLLDIFLDGILFIYLFNFLRHLQQYISFLLGRIFDEVSCFGSIV